MKTIVKAEPLETLRRDYGVRDAKGREIGGQFSIWTRTYSPAPDDWKGHCTHEVGTFLSGTPHATRDGSSYGAGQRTIEYPSLEAAHAAAEDYFTKAAKRAARR